MLGNKSTDLNELAAENLNPFEMSRLSIFERLDQTKEKIYQIVFQFSHKRKKFKKIFAFLRSIVQELRDFCLREISS